MKESFTFALQNIRNFGDTDVFPFPLENHLFFDRQEQIVELLTALHDNFQQSLLNYPPLHEVALTTAGYSAFRSCTQIDPLWNAYLLSLVVALGEDIERERIPTDRQMVFSYRFRPDVSKSSLWDPAIGWLQFQERSLALASQFSHVLVCDISDFYPRIYHHRLENALKKASAQSDLIQRVMRILSRLSRGVSYGLPIGGPAARLLSELLLNRMDRLLLASGVPFCRFVDDYHVFAKSREEAFEHLVLLSEKLSTNEGLTLQKNKTQVLTAEEFIGTSRYAIRAEAEDEDASRVRSFLSLRLYYDPYSDTAEADYENLKQELEQFDVVGMLAKELRKSRIDQTLTSRLIKAVRHIHSEYQEEALLSMLAHLDVLYPVFPLVMIVLKSVIADQKQETQQKVFKVLRDLVRSRSYIIRVTGNLAQLVRVLVHDRSDEADELLASVYRSSGSMMIRRDIILIMAARDADYWVSDVHRNFQNLTEWEKRSAAVASYILEDEGDHWRKANSRQLSQFGQQMIAWAAQRKNDGKAVVQI